jgi:hypothetical protein
LERETPSKRFSSTCTVSHMTGGSV